MTLDSPYPRGMTPPCALSSLLTLVILPHDASRANYHVLAFRCLGSPCFSKRSAQNDTRERAPPRPLPHETLPRSGRVARWTNTPAGIKDPPPPHPFVCRRGAGLQYHLW